VRVSFASGAAALVIVCLPSTPRAADSDVRVSSIGYLTARAKRVSVLGTATGFTVRRASDGTTAFEGTLPAPAADPGTNDMVAQGDFSGLAETGRFYVDVPGVGRSVEFPIGDDVYRRPFFASMVGFYGWRCGTAVSFAFAGDSFAHAACHMGDGYLDYLGQAGAMRDGTGGWHDAGDFGKYTGNAGFTLGMMLSAFERHPAGILQAPLPIPEAGGALPDYLDELRWELDWMLKMMYAADDGRVSHKLTARAFEGFVMPEADTQTRYFVPFATAATADFVAALAQASRIYRPYDEAFADRCLTAARTAYAYLTANTANTAAQTDFTTGGYMTSDPDDRLWAAAEMWETTGDAAALADVETRINAVAATATLVAADFDWGSVRNLGLFTYLLSARVGRTPAVVDRVRASALAAANAVATAHDASGYGRGVTSYYWGSNGSVARTSMLLAVANRLTDDTMLLVCWKTSTSPTPWTSDGITLSITICRRSVPVASSMAARSAMLRASGPPMSCVVESGTMPVRLDSPCVPRRPTRSLCDAGLRIDPQVSLPMPATAKFAATAAPVPPLEPPGLRSRSYGFLVWPNREPTVVIPDASSCMFVLPRITAPAALSRWT